MPHDDHGPECLYDRLAQRGYGGRAMIGEDHDRFSLPLRGRR